MNGKPLINIANKSAKNQATAAYIAALIGEDKES